MMRSTPRWPGLVAAAIATGTDIAYVLLIRAQGDDPVTSGRVLFFAGLMASVAVAAVVGALGPPSVLTGALAVYAAVGLWVVGYLAIFSIGLLLLIALPFAVAGAVGTFRRRADP